MNFLITEDEYNRLHGVQRQLNMMARLFGQMKGFEAPCDPEDLSEFFAAQEAALDAVRKAIDHKYQLTQDVDKPMNWFDWLAVIEVASGDHVPLHPRRAQYIDDALSHLATLDPAYELVVKKWVEVSGKHARRQGAKDTTAADMQEALTDGNLSLELFADLMRAVSGQAMTLDELNETVNQFLKAFDEHHPERAVIVQALNAALIHNGYAWVLTFSQGGQQARWVRQEEATAQATTPAPDKAPKAIPATPNEAAGPVVRATKTKSAAASRQPPAAGRPVIRS